MKKLFAVLVILGLLSTPCLAVDNWLKGKPVSTDSPSILPSLIQVNNNALDRLMAYGRFGCKLSYSSASQFTVAAGSVVCSNSAGTVRRTRANTSATTVTFSNIDTGSEAASTKYYVYAVADTDVETFTVYISLNSSTPTGITYYKRLGYLYNNSSSNIYTTIFDDDYYNANIVQITGTSDITTTSTTYVDMTGMEIAFVSTGQPVKVSFSAPVRADGSGGRIYGVIDIDGTDKVSTAVQGTTTDDSQMTLQWLETLSAGSHTIKVQWKTSTGTVYQEGASKGLRVLIAQEI